jgi:WD40 repeat protein
MKLKNKLISLSEILIFFNLLTLCIIPVQAFIAPQYNGKIVWDNPEIIGMYSVSISNDGSLVAAAAHDGLYLLDSSGNIIWTREPSGDNKAVWSVAISDNGKYIVMGSSNDNAYLYDRGGSLLWEYQTGILGWGGSDIDGVGISNDGTYIVIGDGNGDIHLLNTNGQRKWKYSTGERITFGGIGISGDGKYIAALSDYSNSVYFLNNEGTLLWKKDYSEDKFLIQPKGLAISRDGMYIIVGSTDKNVYFFNNQGNLLWKYNTGNDIGSVAISESGSFVVVGSEHYNMYLLDMEGKPLWYYPTNGHVGGVAITNNGKLIAGEVYDRNVFVLTNPNYAPSPSQIITTPTVSLPVNPHVTPAQIQIGGGKEDLKLLILWFATCIIIGGSVLHLYKKRKNQKKIESPVKNSVSDGNKTRRGIVDNLDNLNVNNIGDNLHGLNNFQQFDVNNNQKKTFNENVVNRSFTADYPGNRTPIRGNFAGICPICGSDMVWRRAKKTGELYRGCTNYNSGCRYQERSY